MVLCGSLGRAGPVALDGYKQWDLVAERSRISEADYQAGLMLAKLAPSPTWHQIFSAVGNEGQFTTTNLWESNQSTDTF
jgi:chromate transport protein ChrA